jgi:hypothetical protein
VSDGACELHRLIGNRLFLRRSPFDHLIWSAQANNYYLASSGKSLSGESGDPELTIVKAYDPNAKKDRPRL